MGGWINELDSIEESASESTLHVYEVINGNADNLALARRFIHRQAANQGGNQPSSQVAPGMQSQTNRSAGAGDMPGTGGLRVAALTLC